MKFLLTLQNICRANLWAKNIFNSETGTVDLEIKEFSGKVMSIILWDKKGILEILTRMGHSFNVI